MSLIIYVKAPPDSGFKDAYVAKVLRFVCGDLKLLTLRF